MDRALARNEPSRSFSTFQSGDNIRSLRKRSGVETSIFGNSGRVALTSPTLLAVNPAPHELPVHRITLQRKETRNDLARRSISGWNLRLESLKIKSFVLPA